MLLIKYHSVSDYSTWTSWNSNMYDVSYDIALDSSNSIYLSGISGNYSNTYYTLVKFNNELNYLWNRTWGPYADNRCHCVAIDSQDNIYLGGYILQNDSHYDICLVKYNSSGEFQWHKIWSWSYSVGDRCFAIAIDSVDNIYLTGTTEDGTEEGINDNLCLLKYNSSGDLQWSIIREAPTYELGIEIELDSNDNIYVIGETAGIKSFLVKYTKDGIFQWDRIYSGDLYCYSTEIAVDSTDYIYIGGENKLTKISGPSASVVKYNTNGTLLWHIEWGEPYIDGCGAIAIDSMDNILLAGDISAYEYCIDGIFIVRNPKSLINPSINGFSIIGVICWVLLGVVLATFIQFKKKAIIN